MKFCEYILEYIIYFRVFIQNRKKNYLFAKIRTLLHQCKFVNSMLNIEEYVNNNWREHIFISLHLESALLWFLVLLSLFLFEFISRTGFSMAHSMSFFRSFPPLSQCERRVRKQKAQYE